MPSLVDTTIRVLSQEPLAGLMPTADLLRLAELLDGAGFAYLEVSGGGVFDSDVRRGDATARARRGPHPAQRPGGTPAAPPGERARGGAARRLGAPRRPVRTGRRWKRARGGARGRPCRGGRDRRRRLSGRAHYAPRLG